MSRLIATAIMFFGIGFYAALLMVAIVLGDDAFNGAFPNPWRLLVLVPVLPVLWAGRPR